MEQIIINLKDHSKRTFLLELLQQLDFVELQLKQIQERKSKERYDFFESAGLFSHRTIDANQLRKQAWGIKK